MKAPELMHPEAEVRGILGTLTDNERVALAGCFSRGGTDDPKPSRLKTLLGLMERKLVWHSRAFGVNEYKTTNLGSDVAILAARKDKS